jgi:LemA protein
MTLFWIAFACLCAAAALLLRAYRRLLALDARCEAAAAEVEAELAKRHAMLPALVGVMRAFLPQEREAVEIVVKTHAAVQRAASPQARLLAETRLGDGVRQALAKAHGVERAQTLRDFDELQAALEETDRRLAAARRNLSAAIDAYNAALGGFPARRLATRLRLAPRVFYDIGAEQGFRDEAAA